MTSGLSESRRRLTSLRLAAQGIAEPRFDRPVDVVRHLLCQQAQDFPGALWSVGLRMREPSQQAVLDALEAREIVRSWPMRGTLHFAPAEDLGWILALTGDRIISRAAGRHRQLELDEESFAHATRVAERLLEREGVVPRAALLSAIEASGLSIEGQRGTHLLWYLAIRGLLVFGPVQGKQHTFALLDEWVREKRNLDGDEALAEFALRYFRSHGPASINDFAWWSSLTLTAARRGLAAVRDQLDAIEVDGVTYFLTPGLEPASAGLELLPGFDEFVLGYQDRSAPLGEEGMLKVVPGNNGVFLPTIVIDGEVVGTWKRSATATELSVELRPFGTVGAKNVSAAREFCARYAAFLNIARFSLK